MNFRQDEEHQDILEMVHDFAVNEVKPLAAEIDRTEEFPMKNVKMMAEMGLMGIPFPEEYGGAGIDTLAFLHILPYVQHLFISLVPKNRNRNIFLSYVLVNGLVLSH